MKNKIKIIIAGIGGVGGYFGGLLAKQFSESIEVEIYFLARGEHLKQIQANGLKVLKGDTAFIAKPTLATDNANEIGVVDYILLCTKSYDLESIIEQLKPCIDNNTAVLPLLNGVESAAKIKSLLPDTNVFDGCVYIVSQVKEHGVIENGGNIQKLYFGQENMINEKLSTLENIFKQAQIEATLTKHITSVLWEKFYLVGANSSATSYYNCSKGEILDDIVKRELLHSLLSEIDQVAKASGIYFDRDMISDTVEKIQSFPYETTSSMQRDFERSGARTELDTITGFIVRAGQKLNLPTPTFNKVYMELLQSK